MTEITPRLAKSSSRRFVLLCGGIRCNGVIGRLKPEWLPRSPFVTPPFRMPGEPLKLDSLFEAQSPLGARGAVIFVLPEGFARDLGSQIWSTTRRGRLRYVAARAGRLPRTATHRPRTRFRGGPLYATAPPLPAEVRCSECGRINNTTSQHLTSLLPAVSDAWNADIAARTDGVIPEPVNDGAKGFTAGRSRDPEQLRKHAKANRGGSPTQIARSGSKRGVFSGTNFAETLFTTPQNDLVVDARLSGREIRPEDFFLLVPERPYMVGEPDPELLDLIAE